MHATPRPHDLLWGMTSEQLLADAPEWARQMLATGQPVVVRRALTAVGQIAVGLRGISRDQRYATVMDVSRALRCVSPEQLIEALPSSELPAFKALAAIKPFLDDLGRSWGVTGSVGYQLATGMPTAHAESDLDLLLRMPCELTRYEAHELQRLLDQACCRVDMQLETPAGAVALREWAGAASRVLLKCSSGARLVGNPWRDSLDQPELVA
ncbi:malonate decarboxylase holo-ACP synthase [Pseudomonas stutzeri]|uniref:malonate decarboxylase holo-ACP synthase n=1 Tax=Stutzerimonas stutzeri TaxID=316 RepID=UPI00210BC220|nr:malonate decarboxylase holo-ACP synthase [Stutzerimonas stutzeri]MCQ4313936.1 malonate decarboxylase holo-ACP synthase [Stutzerimonas stutzeri]